MHRHSLPFWVLLAVAVAVVVAGCARAERVETDPRWPLAWRGLDLYRHDGELAYASNAGAAAEICSLAREVADEFRERTGAEPAAWIHIAVDRGDPSIVAAAGTDHEALLRAMGEVVPGDGSHPGAPDVPPGVEVEVVYALVPFVLPPGTLGPLPADDAPDAEREWVETLIPTSGRLVESTDRLIDAALEAEGVGFWERLVIAPILPFLKGKMRERIEGLLRFALFGYQVASVAEWSPEERRAHLDRYSADLGLDEDSGPLPEVE